MMQYRRGFAVRLKDATQYFIAGRMAEAMPDIGTTPAADHIR